MDKKYKKKKKKICHKLIHKAHVSCSVIEFQKSLQEVNFTQMYGILYLKKYL